MKLKTILQLSEWISHAPAVNRTPDSKLRAIPGGDNDTPAWDGIVEGKGWFLYRGSNDWDKKLSEATVYITENDKPHKIWIKIKTNNLKKPTDTNESHKERIKKHVNKISGKWMSEAKKKHKNLDLNNVGNPITKSWLETFKNSVELIKPYILEWGESEIDPINFTYRK